MSVATQSHGGVRIAIVRDPALVRTVRLVAAALARRADCADLVIEEIRLAVGETCAVMIGVEDSVLDSDEQVEVGISTDAGKFTVTVAGRVESDADSGFAEIGLDPWALLRGLSEDIAVAEADGLTTVRLCWSL